jgi:hypothetical protein
MTRLLNFAAAQQNQIGAWTLTDPGVADAYTQDPFAGAPAQLMFVGTSFVPAAADTVLGSLQNIESAEAARQQAGERVAVVTQRGSVWSWPLSDLSKDKLKTQREPAGSRRQTLPTPAPSLFDIVKDGKKIPALAQTGKQGFVYILDRLTGKPVFGIEEKPVARGDVPTEWYPATQPIPVKRAPPARLWRPSGPPRWFRKTSTGGTEPAGARSSRIGRPSAR